MNKRFEVGTAVKWVSAAWVGSRHLSEKSGKVTHSRDFGSKGVRYVVLEVDAKGFEHTHTFTSRKDGTVKMAGSETVELLAA